MSASRLNTPSARKVSFAPHTTSHDPNKSIAAKCEDIFSSGLETIHCDIRTNDTVNEIKTSFVQSLIKRSEKDQLLKRTQAPDFMPHSIRFNPKLKTDLVTAKREDYKELSGQFDSIVADSKQKLKEIMIKAKEIEFETKNNILCQIVSRFTKEVTEEFFIIYEYAENSVEVYSSEIAKIHDVVLSSPACKLIQFGEKPITMPSPKLPETVILVDSDTSDSEDNNEEAATANDDQNKRNKRRRTSTNDTSDEAENTNVSNTSNTTMEENKNEEAVSNHKGHPHPNAISYLAPIVETAVVRTLVNTTISFYDFQKDLVIKTRLLKRREQQKIASNIQKTASETEKLLKELDNGQTIKDMIDEALKDKSKQDNKSSKERRGVKKPRKNASLKKQNASKEKKTQVNNKQRKVKDDSGAGKKKGSEKVKQNDSKKLSQKQKKKKLPSKQKK